MSTLLAPNRQAYPIKSTVMRGDDLWVCLDTTMPERPASCQWFKAFDLAGHWQENHATIDELRGITRQHRVDAVDMGYEFTVAQAPIQGCELPPHMKDIVIAMTEIMNMRNPARQASRDLYVVTLYEDIEAALAA